MPKMIFSTSNDNHPHSGVLVIVGASLLLLLIVLSIRIIIVLQQIKSSSKTTFKSNRQRKVGQRRKPAKTLVVLGSGGHTTEMLRLLSSITNHSDYSPLDYIIASTDTSSQNRLEAFHKEAAQAAEQRNITEKGQGRTPIKPICPPPHRHIFKIPRAREVGQSYLTSIFTTLYSILYTAQIVLIKTRPDILLINGPGTCLPIALWTFIGRVLGLCEGQILFCESFCRVKSLSLTGNILWKLGIVDLFLVHWPELKSFVKKKVGGKDDNHQRMILLDSFIKH